jgi:DNA-binding transcriptional MerR regulator
MSARSPGPRAKPEKVRALYRTRDVVDILGVSRRQLQYWAQTDLVTPSFRTPGGHHRYTFEDLVALKTAVRLIEAGVSLQRIRRAIRALVELLPSVQRPLAELVLVATGDVVLAFREGTVFEAISGQEWIFDVARFQRDLEARGIATGGRSVRGVRPVRRQRQWRRTA